MRRRGVSGDSGGESGISSGRWNVADDAREEIPNRNGRAIFSSSSRSLNLTGAVRKRGLAAENGGESFGIGGGTRDGMNEARAGEEGTKFGNNRRWWRWGGRERNAFCDGRDASLAW